MVEMATEPPNEHLYENPAPASQPESMGKQTQGGSDHTAERVLRPI
jgi:hypothetical protein